MIPEYQAMRLIGTECSEFLSMNSHRSAGHVRHWHIVTESFKNAYAATFDNGKSGTVLFIYSHKTSYSSLDGNREVLDERVYTTPNIAEEMREFLGDRSPASCVEFSSHLRQDVHGGMQHSAVRDAENEATILVYGK